MTASGPWIVRLGKVRGEGAYVHDDTWSPAPGLYSLFATTFQRDARRFSWRATAVDYARAFGGRVVRLRERAR